VIGRPIRTASDPGVICDSIAEGIGAAIKELQQ